MILANPWENAPRPGRSLVKATDDNCSRKYLIAPDQRSSVLKVV